MITAAQMLDQPFATMPDLIAHGRSVADVGRSSLWSTPQLQRGQMQAPRAVGWSRIKACQHPHFAHVARTGRSGAAPSRATRLRGTGIETALLAPTRANPPSAVSPS